MGELPEDLENLPELLSDIYFCNFSSSRACPTLGHRPALPDLPHPPAQRRAHPPRVSPTSPATPTARSTTSSTSAIDKKILELHEVKDLPGECAGVEPYYLGVFLARRIPGDPRRPAQPLGDTHAVHLSLRRHPRAEWEIDEVIEGDTVEEVLSTCSTTART
jgi:arginine decarboxylase-like protein